MEFDNSFEVPLPPGEAWKVLLDIERIAPCMPGAELSEVLSENTYKGKINVRLGHFVIQAIAISENKRIQENQTSDSFRDSFRYLGDDGATEAVTQQNNVIERIVHYVVHDRLCALRMVHIFLNSFPMACDRGSKCLVSFAFEVLDGRLPGCPIVPGTMHQDESRHRQIPLIHFGISQKTVLR